MVETVEDFAEKNNTESRQFLLAAGNAGIEAATNIEIQKAQLLMTVLVYSVVFLACLITFRSPRGALCLIPALARALNIPAAVRKDRRTEPAKENLPDESSLGVSN